MVAVTAEGGSITTVYVPVAGSDAMFSVPPVPDRLALVYDTPSGL
jgi:hypothetical protein